MNDLFLWGLTGFAAVMVSMRAAFALADHRRERAIERSREQILAAQMRQATTAPGDSGWLTALSGTGPFDMSTHPAALPPPRAEPVPLGHLIADLKTGGKQELLEALERGSRDSRSPEPRQGAGTGLAAAGIGASLTASRMSAREFLGRQQIQGNLQALMGAMAPGTISQISPNFINAARQRAMMDQPVQFAIASGAPRTWYFDNQGNRVIT